MRHDIEEELDSVLAVCSLKKHQTQTKTVIQRSVVASAVCRLQQRCAAHLKRKPAKANRSKSMQSGANRNKELQRCAAHTSGGPLTSAVCRFENNVDVFAISVAILAGAGFLITAFSSELHSLTFRADHHRFLDKQDIAERTPFGVAARCRHADQSHQMVS